MFGKGYDFEKYASIPLRLGVGIYLLISGVQMAMDPTLQLDFISLFEKTWLVPVGVGASFVTFCYVLKILIGIFLIVGLLTRLMGALVTIGAVGTILILNFVLGFGEGAMFMGTWGLFILKDLVLLGAGLALFMLGSHEFSVDQLIHEGKTKKK